MRKLSKDIVVLPEERGYWVIMNVFARTCMAVTNDGLVLLRAVETMSDSELKNKFGDNRFSICEIEYFSTIVLLDPKTLFVYLIFLILNI